MERDSGITATDGRVRKFGRRMARTYDLMSLNLLDLLVEAETEIAWWYSILLEFNVDLAMDLIDR